MLLIWPGFITVEAVVLAVEFLYQRFAQDGSPLIYTATVTLEEVLDVRVTSEVLREEV